MALLSKGSKQDNFESHNSLKLNFTNIQGLCSNFTECKSFLESNSLDILALSETIDCGNFSLIVFLPLMWKDSITHYARSCSLCKGMTSMGYTSRKLCGFLLMFSTGFTSVSITFFPLSITFFNFMHGSCNIDEVLSINPSGLTQMVNFPI